MTEDKLNRIEETLAHQDQQIQDLNDVIIRQDQDIANLKAYLLKMQRKIQSLEDTTQTTNSEALSVTEQAARNKPPHY